MVRKWRYLQSETLTSIAHYVALYVVLMVDERLNLVHNDQVRTRVPGRSA